MRIILAILLGVICLNGCATDRESIRSSKQHREELFVAVDKWATFHSREEWPPEIRTLRPVATYLHISNMVIVLSWDGHTERGFCVMPLVSSYIPGSVHEADWKFKYIGNMVWEYERTREPSTSLESMALDDRGSAAAGDTYFRRGSAFGR